MIRPEKKNLLKALLQDLPIRYRLSLPFFLLAFLGTTSLVWISIHSQNTLIRQQESQRLNGAFQSFQHNIDLHGRWAISLASNYARNPEIAQALARKDRLRLLELCYPSYIFMKSQFGISQVHFEVSPGRSFLRLHRLYEYGDLLVPSRRTIADALEEGRVVHGLEKGLTGYGIRGVVPVSYEGRVIGTVEVGFNFGPIFLEDLRRQFDVEASVLLPQGETDRFKVFSSTFQQKFRRDDPVYEKVFRSGRPRSLSRRVLDTPYAVLVGPVKDYQGATVALVELDLDRSRTLKTLRYYMAMMVGVGVVGMLLSVGAIYLVSLLFTRPIARMVDFAKEIAWGNQSRHLETRPSGELGVLADSLLEMLHSLEEGRQKIRDYADNLEKMIHLRTRALRESEEKYRTLVENVPLVVYRLLGDGRTIFINLYIEEIMGISHLQALGDERFWKEKVWERDRERVWPLMDRCVQEGRSYNVEYRVRHADGRLVFVLDHALPVLDDQGNVETVDGFLVDVTDRHRLQQQVLQMEELRTLSEVSARLAHEIRNPLAAAGGFARRLLQALPHEDPNRSKVQIIVHEVARLEKILEKTLAYLKPFDVVLQRHSLNDLVGEVLDTHKGEGEAAPVKFQPAEHLPPVLMDRELLKKAMESVIQALLDYSRDGQALEVSTRIDRNGVSVEMVLKGVHVSEDDVEHFFYPFTSRASESEAMDLPLAKMIIHKHKGLIHLSQKNSQELKLSVTLPD